MSDIPPDQEKIVDIWLVEPDGQQHNDLIRTVQHKLPDVLLRGDLVFYRHAVPPDADKPVYRHAVVYTMAGEIE